MNIPVVASGGAGTPEHLRLAFEAGADAALAASIFHYNEYSIPDTKAYLAARGVPVRVLTSRREMADRRGRRVKNVNLITSFRGVALMASHRRPRSAPAPYVPIPINSPEPGLKVAATGARASRRSISSSAPSCCTRAPTCT